jgi:iron complex transport system permease protein
MYQALVTIVIAIELPLPRQYPLSLAKFFASWRIFSPDGVAGQVVVGALPRIVMALLAGGALGLCGATLQGVFQNPLVDPHIIGVTSGSAFGGRWRFCWG